MDTPILELHLSSSNKNNTVGYQVGFFKKEDKYKNFYILAQGACTDEEYIINKVQKAYGHMDVFKNGELELIA